MKETEYTRYYYNTDIKKGIYRVRDINGKTLKTVHIHEETKYGITTQDLLNLKRTDMDCDNADRREENHFAFSLDATPAGMDENLRDNSKYLANDTWDPERLLMEKERQRIIKEKIAEIRELLGDRQLSLLLLYVDNKKTLTEIAEMYGYNSPQAVKKAIKSINKKLEKHYGIEFSLRRNKS